VSTSLAAKPLTIGGIELTVPVVLAPMAGITNTAFRRLCREYGAGLYVSEMITSRALVERTPESMRLIRHHESETPRSIQLYGVDPKTVREAVTMLVAEDRADHIDLNFGCPVPKVTRKGGGAALPWKLDLFREIVEGAVDAAGRVPLTIKMRKGIDAEHLTYLEAGRIAEGAGVASIALHARTASEFYSGHADWSAIAKLKETITDVPVLGNGDIWSAEDALRMVAETGCDGVVVGRGCLGKPWLFGDLAAAFGGSRHGGSAAYSTTEGEVGSAAYSTTEGEVGSAAYSTTEGEVGSAAYSTTEYIQPNLGEVARAFKRHAELLVEFFDDEVRACRDIRKHVAWYFKGYAVGGETRAALAMSSSLDEIDQLLGGLDADQPYPGASAEGQRGRAGTPKTPSLPDRWLDSREIAEGMRAEVADAELHNSGG
jgi:nifR3 family TIM-barrel protein